jgi:hypothetical protein
MVSAARQIALDLSPLVSQAGALLLQLREAHERVAGEMEKLDRITLGPLPDGPEFTAARWQLSQASLRRRTLSARIADLLGGRIDDGDAHCLRMLQSENRIAISRSARHIQDWTTQSIRRDWIGYCMASRAIRTQMKANILLEQQILYPILRRLEHQGS